MGNLQMLLRQHIGAPCKPVVAVGDKVAKGTLIAEPAGLGANILPVCMVRLQRLQRKRS